MTADGASPGPGLQLFPALVTDHVPAVPLAAARGAAVAALLAPLAALVSAAAGLRAGAFVLAAGGGFAAAVAAYTAADRLLDGAREARQVVPWLALLAGTCAALANGIYGQAAVVDGADDGFRAIGAVLEDRAARTIAWVVALALVAAVQLAAHRRPSTAEAALAAVGFAIVGVLLAPVVVGALPRESAGFVIASPVLAALLCGVAVAPAFVLRGAFVAADRLLLRRWPAPDAPGADAPSPSGRP